MNQDSTEPQMEISDLHHRQAERRAVWIALIVATGIGLSLFFACATPFVAVATLASLKIQRREAVAAVGLVWMANQAIGYGILGYPWTLDSAAWGVAIGMSAFLALLAATALTPIRAARIGISLPFIGAFATFEMCLYLAGFVLPGGEGGFTAAVVGRIFVVNLVALVGVLAVYQLAALAFGLLRGGDVQQPIASVSR
jgi:hypothetical protein